MRTPQWLKRLFGRAKKETREVIVTLTNEEYEKALEAARFLGKKLNDYIRDHLPK